MGKLISEQLKAITPDMIRETSRQQSTELKDHLLDSNLQRQYGLLNHHLMAQSGQTDPQFQATHLGNKSPGAGLQLQVRFSDLRGDDPRNGRRRKDVDSSTSKEAARPLCDSEQDPQSATRFGSQQLHGRSLHVQGRSATNRRKTEAPLQTDQHGARGRIGEFHDEVDPNSPTSERLVDELEEMSTGRAKNPRATQPAADHSTPIAGIAHLPVIGSKINPKRVRGKQKNYIIKQWEDDEGDHGGLDHHLNDLKDLPLNHDQASEKSTNKQQLLNQSEKHQ